MTDMICIDGWYEDGDDAYHYEIYLRPWGLYWDDMEEERLSRTAMTDWYLPLIDAGKSMPDCHRRRCAGGSCATEGAPRRPRRT